MGSYIIARLARFCSQQWGCSGDDAAVREKKKSWEKKESDGTGVFEKPAVAADVGARVQCPEREQVSVCVYMYV